MVDDFIVWCGELDLTIVGIDDNGLISEAYTYEIQCKDGLTSSPEEWFDGLGKSLSQIPKSIRKRINFVIPPSSEIFVKHLQIPEVTEKGAKEAFRFELESSFAGHLDDWYFDIYQPNDQKNHAFGMAVKKVFSDRLIDIFLRKKIQFSFFCPEILLGPIAIRKYTDIGEENVLLMHVDKLASCLSCFGQKAEYMRMLPIVSYELSKMIADLQNITVSAAESLQLEFLSNPNPEANAFMAYYVKQFSQKFRQELKRSELFFCRTFNQNPIHKIFLSGSRKELSRCFEEGDDVSYINAFDVLSHRIHENCTVTDVIKDNICVFAGAAYCLRNKQSNVLNLFSESFSDQLQFQRQNFSYLLVGVMITLLSLVGLKILRKDVASLEAKRAVLEAKLLETDIDIERYNEICKKESELGCFIEHSKLALCSQAGWMNFFGQLQGLLQPLKMAWIDSFEWQDLEGKKTCHRIHISAKMLVMEDGIKKTASENITKFIESIANLPDVRNVETVKISSPNDDVVSFSFDINLNEQARMLIK